MVVVEFGVQCDDAVDRDGEAVGKAAGRLAPEHQQVPADVVPAGQALRAVTARQIGFHDDA